MDAKEKYLKIKIGNKNVFDILNELKKESNSIDSIVKLREVFPELTLIEAKEILIISETSFNSLDEYQQNFLNHFEKLSDEDF
ncbi:hypothetical protein DI487_06790 [Flavobacterium sediminis]|uniref:Uncharacterized protein n=1 Tax=Flavobacterium sediminis TaxID=2201181 RepID=A0A2U8QTT7_9FLAO|nr:hypothetical protein [Flavobacterium sediminis]AWM13597.1 hypothetical protein DI487_06790 [Flavobacterium sediminis]